MCAQPKINTQHRKSNKRCNIEITKTNVTQKDEEMMQPTKMSSTRNPKHLYIVEFAFANVVQPTFDKSDA
jgi:hypothetical protein